MSIDAKQFALVVEDALSSLEQDAPVLMRDAYYSLCVEETWTDECDFVWGYIRGYLRAKNMVGNFRVKNVLELHAWRAGWVE